MIQINALYLKLTASQLINDIASILGACKLAVAIILVRNHNTAKNFVSRINCITLSVKVLHVKLSVYFILFVSHNADKYSIFQINCITYNQWFCQFRFEM